MTANSAPRPSFLFIGAAKSGSTWIHDALSEHPSVFIPRAKDLQFFDYQYDLGLDWYLQNFEKAGTAQALGELSHDYYLSADAARRIRQDLPDVRLICCLREPGDFAVSVLRWWHSHTRRFGSTFREMAGNPHFTNLLAYRKNLEIYFDLFPADQIRVVFYEQLKADPQRFITDLYRFIGVDPSYQPTVLAGRSNVTRPPRSRAFLIFAVAAADLLRRMGAANLVGAVKRNRFFDKLVYSGNRRSEDSCVKVELDRIADSVRERTAGDMEALAQLIGKPVPAEWFETAGQRT